MKGRVCVGLSVLVGLAFSSNYDEPALTSLARSTVIAEVQGLKAPTLSKADPVLPVFVTIEVDGKIRGCRGSLTTRERSLQAEIVRAAQGAAAHDPRYSPVKKSELKNFKVTVTIVEDQRPINDVAGLHPSEGLALESGNKWGVVLPWEGKDPSVRLDWAYRKAGVAQGSPVKLFRLIATRFRG